MSKTELKGIKQSNSTRSFDIPIPSFACVSVSPPSASAANANANGDDNIEETTTTVVQQTPHWNKSLLYKTEGALRVHRLRRGGSGRWWSHDGQMRLDDFYALVQEQSLVETPKDALATQDPNGLSLSERLLYDLVCVSSPVLYQLTWRSRNRCWCLQMMDYEGNRMEKLGHLLSATEVNVAKRDTILQAIKEHASLSSQKNKEMLSKDLHPATEMSATRGATTTTCSTARSPSSSRKQIVEPFIRPTMTLEDRVRARANAKRQREADLSSTVQTEKQHVDESSLLRLADAMWSYSNKSLGRRVQQEQKYDVSNQTRNEAAHQARPLFSMTVKDVVRLFAGSLVSQRTGRTAAAVSIAMHHQQHQVSREKATRVELLQALRHLQRLVPEWISFSSSSLSKDTFVRLSPTADYTAVRTKLGAPKRRHDTTNTRQPLLWKHPHNSMEGKTTLSGSSRDQHSSLSASSFSLSRRSTNQRKRPAQDSLPSKSNKKTELVGSGVSKRLTFTDAADVDDSGKLVAQAGMH